MSWALMYHPDGLPCQLFITHAWQEGVYEFLDKAIHSWWSGLAGAYICFLSNPQNLDISDLLRDPGTSPFAMALKRCSHVMVIPNHVGSIYGRLWCSYEAYLAYTQEKTIYTASASVRVEAWKNALYGLACCAVPAIVGTFSLLVACPNGWLRCPKSDPDTGEPDDFFGFIFFVCSMSNLASAFIAACSRRPRLRFRCSEIQAVFVGLEVAVQINFATSGWTERFHKMSGLSERAAQRRAWVDIVPNVSWLALAIASMVDTTRLVGQQAEQIELRRNFHGQVAQASCTSDGDAHRIRSELSGREDRVDQAVNVLIESGMSTEYTRESADRGVPLLDVGRTMFAPVVFSWMQWTVNLSFSELVLIDAASLQGQEPSEGVWIKFARWSLPHLWLLHWAYLPRERKAFAARSNFNLTLLYNMLQTLIVFFDASAKLTATVEENRESFIEDANDYSNFQLIFGILRLVIAAVGAVRIARVPSVGPCLARWLGLAGCWTNGLCTSCTDTVRRSTIRQSVRDTILIELSPQHPLRKSYCATASEAQRVRMSLANRNFSLK